MKKLFTLLTAILLTFIYSTSVFGMTTPVLHEAKTEQALAKGTTLTTIKRFTTNGWLNINVIKVDLQEEHISSDILFSQDGIGNTNNLINLTNTNQNIVAAVNGDYFSKLSGTSGSISWPVGIMVKDGEILSTHSYYEDKFASLAILKENVPYITYWNSNSNLKTSSGKECKISLINKYFSDFTVGYIIMFDKNWGDKSVGTDGPHKNITEVVVENSVVKEIRKNMPGTKIPENGFVLCAIPENNSFLDSLVLGEHIDINIETSPNINITKTAIGGGTMLVKNGQLTPIKFKHYGKNPFTAIGIDKSNKYLYIATVDGRQSASMGMNQEELALFMKDELQCYNAIEMDGGGSTTMAAKLAGNEYISVINSPSDGCLRSINNGFAIVNNAPHTLKPATLIIKPSYDDVFVNTSIKLDIKAIDENFNRVAIDTNKIVWSVEGVSGNIKNNTFYPKSAGTATITATYDEIKTSCTIKVLSPPVEISLNPSRFSGDVGQQFNILVKGKNKDGFTTNININDIKWSFKDDSAEIINDKLVIKKQGDNIFEASINNVKTYGLICSSAKVVVDNFESENASFLGYPNEIKGAYGISSSESKSGKHCGTFLFDFTPDVNATKAAYLKFNSPIAVNNDVSKIGIWVNSKTEYTPWLRAQLRDKNGSVIRLSLARNVDLSGWKYLESNLPQNAAYPLSLERIYIAEIDSTIKTNGMILFDDLTFTTKYSQNDIAVPAGTQYKDYLNIPSNSDNKSEYKFAVFGEIFKPNSEINNLISDKVYNTVSKQGNLALFVGKNDSQALQNLNIPYLSSNNINQQDINNNSFITLDSSNGGLRETNPLQWMLLKSKLPLIKNNNVFFLMSTPLEGKNGFKDSLELQLLKDTITDNIIKSQNKNAFFFMGNEKTEVKVYNGVRYVSIKGLDDDTNAKNYIENLKDLKYILVTVNNDKVTYEIKNLFE